MINWQEIDRLVQASRIVDPTSSEKDLWHQLRIWWCVKFGRPMKDPLLDSYSLNDLVLEYLTYFYMDPENDPVEKKKKEKAAKEDEEWALRQLQNAQPQKTEVVLLEKKSLKKSKRSKKPVKSQAPPDLPEISTKFDE